MCEQHPQAWPCSDRGCGRDLQNDHSVGKRWDLPHRRRSGWKGSTAARLVAMLPPKEPPGDSPSASPGPLWTRHRSEHPQVLPPPPICRSSPAPRLRHRGGSRSSLEVAAPEQRLIWHLCEFVCLKREGLALTSQSGDWWGVFCPLSCQANSLQYQAVVLGIC